MIEEDLAGALDAAWVGADYLANHALFELFLQTPGIKGLARRVSGEA